MGGARNSGHNMAGQLTSRPTFDASEAAAATDDELHKLMQYLEVEVGSIRRHVENMELMLRASQCMPSPLLVPQVSYIPRTSY